MRLLAAIAMCFLAGCSDPAPTACGDGVCASAAGESCASCAADCGACAGCGDGTCSVSLGESCASCSLDCGACAGCGDGTCAGDETCSTCPGDCGMCSTSCGPPTCAGCCDGDACLGGASTAGCGSGGNVCMACAPGFLCAGATCEVDGASRWNLVLEYLEVSSTYYTDEAWDGFGGAPDPFVVVLAGSTPSIIGRSGTATDVFAVSYDGTPVATDVRADLLQAYLTFRAFDEDVTSNDRVGECGLVGLPDAAFAGTTQILDCPRDAVTLESGFTLYWHLERF